MTGPAGFPPHRLRRIKTPTRFKRGTCRRRGDTVSSVERASWDPSGGAAGRGQLAEGLYGPDSGFYSNPAPPVTGKRRELAVAPNLFGHVVPKVVAAGTWRCVQRAIQQDEPTVVLGLARRLLEQRCGRAHGGQASRGNSGPRRSVQRGQMLDGAWGRRARSFRSARSAPTHTAARTEVPSCGAGSEFFRRLVGAARGGAGTASCRGRASLGAGGCGRCGGRDTPDSAAGTRSCPASAPRGGAGRRALGVVSDARSALSPESRVPAERSLFAPHGLEAQVAFLGAAGLRAGWPPPGDASLVAAISSSRSGVARVPAFTGPALRPPAPSEPVLRVSAGCAPEPPRAGGGGDARSCGRRVPLRWPCGAWAAFLSASVPPLQSRLGLTSPPGHLCLRS